MAILVRPRAQSAKGAVKTDIQGCRQFVWFLRKAALSGFARRQRIQQRPKSSSSSKNSQSKLEGKVIDRGCCVPMVAGCEQRGGVPALSPV